MIPNFNKPNDGEAHPPYPSFWQAVALLCAMLAIQFLILIPVVAGGYKLTEERDWWALAVEVPLLILSTLGALGIAATWPNANLAETLKFPAISTRTAVALVASLAGVYLLMEGLQGAQIHATAFHPWLKKQFAENPFDHLTLWPALFYGTLIAPICEELLFRGVILGGFLRRYPTAQAIAFCSLLFGAIHLNVTQILGAFVAGFLLGWWRVQTNGLTAPILLHAAFNCAATSLLAGNLMPGVDFYYTQQGLLTSLGFAAAGASTLFAVIRFYRPPDGTEQPHQGSA